MLCIWYVVGVNLAISMLVLESLLRPSPVNTGGYSRNRKARQSRALAESVEPSRLSLLHGRDGQTNGRTGM